MPVISGNMDHSNKRNAIRISADVVNWTLKITALGPLARTGDATLTFNGAFYVIGGYSGTPRDDVWSAPDGVDWRRGFRSVIRFH